MHEGRWVKKISFHCCYKYMYVNSSTIQFDLTINLFDEDNKFPYVCARSISAC